MLIGGHGDAALRRAARVADGWLHGGGDPAELPALLARLAELRQAEGTDGRPFEVHVISMDAYSVDGIRRLADQGVTDVIVGFRWPYAVGQTPSSCQPSWTTSASSPTRSSRRCGASAGLAQAGRADR